MLATGFGQSGLPWEDCWHEDRGDGALVVMPPGITAKGIIHPLPEQLRTLIRLHNHVSQYSAKIQLRAAAHIGPVEHDGKGFVGAHVNHLFRLLDARPSRMSWPPRPPSWRCVLRLRLRERGPVLSQPGPAGGFPAHPLQDPVHPGQGVDLPSRPVHVKAHGPDGRIVARYHPVPSGQQVPGLRGRPTAARRYRPSRRAPERRSSPAGAAPGWGRSRAEARR